MSPEEWATLLVHFPAEPIRSIYFGTEIAFVISVVASMEGSRSRSFVKYLSSALL